MYFRAFCAPGHVTQFELEQPSLAKEVYAEHGIAGRSEPSGYKPVRAMRVLADPETAGEERVSFPLAVRVPSASSAFPVGHHPGGSGESRQRSGTVINGGTAQILT
jgi:hypothetical protein